MSPQLSPASATASGRCHGTSKLYVAVAVVVLLQMCFLVAWTGTSPLQYEVSVDIVRGFQVDSSGACVARGAAPGFLYTFVCLHAGMLLYGSFLAYEMRNLPDEFAETKYVAFAIVAHLQTKLIFILAAAFSFGSPLIFFLVKLLTLTASDLGTMLLLVVPKIFVVCSNKSLGASAPRMQAAKNKLVKVAIQSLAHAPGSMDQPPGHPRSTYANVVPMAVTFPHTKPPALRPATTSALNSDAASMSARASASQRTSSGATIPESILASSAGGVTPRWSSAI